jgi:predicted dehydrogenase
MIRRETKQVLIIGFGSIGKRHKEVCEDLGFTVSIVSSHVSNCYGFYNSIKSALSECMPDYIVIANETYKHLQTIKSIKKLGFNGNILVEKPIFKNYSNEDLSSFKSVKVAYNLRFHPLIQKLKDLIKDENIISSNFYVGHYLPEWRPGTDYKKSYSSSKEKGGGVLLDLSHDLDLIKYLLGGFEKLAAIGGKFSKLEISSDDTFAMLIQSKKCPVTSIQLNYTDRKAKRRIIINTDLHSFEVELVSGDLYIDNEFINIETDYNDSYRKMHLNMMKNNYDTLCDFKEGLYILDVIKKSLSANINQNWINI